MAKIFKDLQKVESGYTAFSPPIKVIYSPSDIPDAQYGTFGRLCEHRLEVISRFSTGHMDENEVEFRSKKALLMYLYGDVASQLHNIASLISSGSGTDALASIDALILDITTP